MICPSIINFFAQDSAVYAPICSEPVVNQGAKFKVNRSDRLKKVGCGNVFSLTPIEDDQQLGTALGSSAGKYSVVANSYPPGAVAYCETDGISGKVLQARRYGQRWVVIFDAGKPMPEVA